MIISHKYKFIYFACGKTGTHSVEASLRKYHDGGRILQVIDAEQQILRARYSLPFNLRHARPEFVRELIDPEIWNNYFKFVFVRNPWDWVLSNYCFNHRNLVQYLFTFDPIHVNLVWHLMKVHNQTPYAESYFQHTFVVDQQDNPLMDFVGKMEDFQKDYNNICSVIGIKPGKLKRKNRTEHPRYQELYSEEAKKLVAELYKKDIEILGYEF